MRTRVSLGLVVVAAIAVAIHFGDLAAAYVAIAGGAIVVLLHAIEFKINKLLDERGIRVYDDEIARD